VTLADEIRSHAPYAEWRDKHIHYVDGPTVQNWLIHLYIPVDINNPDKSVKSAIENYLKEFV